MAKRTKYEVKNTVNGFPAEIKTVGYNELEAMLRPKVGRIKARRYMANARADFSSWHSVADIEYRAIS